VSKFKAKVDLIAIKAAAQVINGNVPDVKDANFGSEFRTARYAIILLAALTPMFEDRNIQIQNFTCVNFYRLEKVARFLGLVFDRTRTAEKVYRDLESKHRVRFFKQENRTFVTITKQGLKKYQEILQQFQVLDKYLKSITSLQNQQSEERQSLGTSLVRGIRIKPREMKELKLTVNEHS
jgi:hypothetical protein